MAKTKNPVWRSLASVKLALVTLIILAIVSIIGTLITQGQPADYYVEEYGQQLAGLFEQLGFTTMYSSWWFVALLGLFAVNLIVCSIERLPVVWRQVSSSNLDIDPGSLGKMSCSHQLETGLTVGASAEKLQTVLAASGWNRPDRKEQDGSILFAAQKGAWTRFGVYVVHLSILVILVGAIVGSLFGYQAYVFIPEGTSSSKIFLRKDKTPVPLGYELQCNWFEKSYYPNGMIKQYRADLTVLDPGNSSPLKKSVTVNDPLTYRGLTYYVGDGFPMDEYLLKIRNLQSGQEQWFRTAAERATNWEVEGISFLIDELAFDEEGNALRGKISISTGEDVAPSTLWLNANQQGSMGWPGKDYAVSYRQLNSTLLLVTKDPGVTIVYAGFCLMILGLAVSFFLSHRRIWLLVEAINASGTRITLGGGSNKNKPAFARSFAAVVDRIMETIPDSSRKSKKQRK